MIITAPSTAERELAKAVSDYYDDPLGFVLFAYPWGKPGQLEKYIGPDDNQGEFLTSLGNEVRQRKFVSTPVRNGAIFAGLGRSQ
jgi:hypothetical protein